MQPECSLPCSQKPIITPYPEPDTVHALQFLILDPFLCYIIYEYDYFFLLSSPLKSGYLAFFICNGNTTCSLWGRDSVAVYYVD